MTFRKKAVIARTKGQQEDVERPLASRKRGQLRPQESTVFGGQAETPRLHLIEQVNRKFERLVEVYNSKPIETTWTLAKVPEAAES